MRNHWLEVYRQKGQRWWTVEFFYGRNYRQGGPLLKCRRVDVEDTNQLRYPTGTISLIFRNVSAKDQELMDFLQTASRGMGASEARLHHNRGVFPVLVEIENYEISTLFFNSIKAPSLDEVRFTFGFNSLVHTVV